MKWIEYKSEFFTKLLEKGFEKRRIIELLEYAKKLHDKKVPIIYDQEHLSVLLGYKNEYLHRITNSPKHFYRDFSIEKKNGKKRNISEPLPDLKSIQNWILHNILYKVKCSRFTKAYTPGKSLKDNARFHCNQKYVVCIDVKNFFPSLKEGLVLNLFQSLGYNIDVSVMLTKLCCYKGCLPQGGVTSPYLSNLLLKNFDEIISKYCVANKIRYTRYADDLSFSGDFEIGKLVAVVKRELSFLGLETNDKKFRVLRRNCKQTVTGLVVNDGIHVDRSYKLKIRQEIYYMKKYGVVAHLKHLQETRENYIYHMIGKVNYVLSIEPQNEDMKEYMEYLKTQLTSGYIV